jgi:Lon protease-like protein
VAAGGDQAGGAPRTLTVPLFPLPTVALFPRVRQPFYIFEPRYRALLRHVLDRDGLIGFPMLVQAGGDAPGNDSAIVQTFGVGQVADYETHDDGTSHVEVLGRFRAKLLEELPPVQFRQARVEELPEREPEEAAVQALQKSLAAALKGLNRLGLTPDAKEALGQILESSARDLPFAVHMLCTVVVGNPEVRQKLLEEDDVLMRGQALVTMLDTFRQELGRPPAGA